MPNKVKASGRSTGGSLTLIEVTIDGGPPRHTHQGYGIAGS